MADMNAMFAMRKKKKGKKGVNFNQILDQVDLLETHKQVVQEFDNDGNVIKTQEVAVPKNVGNLTAAVNASRKKLEKANDSVINVESTSTELAAGEWVNDDAKPASATATFLQGSAANKVVDLEGLSSSKKQLRSLDVIEQEEQNKKLFHWTRKQAMEEAQANELGMTAKKAPEEPAKPQFFRPRAMMEANQNREGLAALKELDNEKVFPSLGGAAPAAAKKPARTAAAGSVWGVVKREVIEELAVKQEDGEYLGEEFLAAEEFDGQKKGYAFKKGHKGLGYYWEGPLQHSLPGEDDEEPAEAEAEEETPVEAETGADEATAADQPEPAEEEDPVKKAAEEEKERRRRAKKAEKERQKAEWEREQKLAQERFEREEREKEERAKAEADTAAAAPVVAAADAPVEPPPPEDRFAGLKKKKKKKKADA